MILCVNMLLEHVDEDPQADIDRVLWLSSATDEVVLISLNESNATPRFERYSVLCASLENGERRILEKDPFARLLRHGDDIPEKHVMARDRAWKTIEPIIQLARDGQYIRAERGPVIAGLVAEKRAAKSVIYDHLRRYWQGGQVKNALLPRFDNCGAPGKEKPDTSNKRGRPRKFTEDGEKKGVNATEDIKRLFRLGINAFYLNPKNPTKMTLREAYARTIERYFNVGYEFQNGSRVPVLPSGDSLPTFKQFEYWYFREARNDVSQTIIAREGERPFNLKRRAVTGNAASHAFGPGSCFQIDSTPGDIHLVSSLDQSPIGRPTIYLVVDVFSRLIAGVSVTVENPSFISAMLALENATCDKVEFCARHNIQIAEREWPSRYLPEAILADRGELHSKEAGRVAEELNIHLSNTPPYRADLKPFVERMFRSLKDELISQLPGAILKETQRGEHDPRLSAVLTLQEFRTLVIHWVLDHNRKRIEAMREDEFIVKNRLEPRPLDVWECGTRHRSGKLRVMAPDVIRLHLLPTESATVTAKGIRFRQTFYTCERALTEQWFVRARAGSSWKVNVSFDPRDAGILFLRPARQRGFEECRLLETDKFYAQHSWADIIAARNTRALTKETNHTTDLQMSASHRAAKETILAAAKERTAAATAGQSKTERRRGMVENRQEERDRERHAHKPTVETKATNVVPMSAAEADYLPRPSYLDVLRQTEDELANDYAKSKP
jgi:putative transposase